MLMVEIQEHETDTVTRKRVELTVGAGPDGAWIGDIQCPVADEQYSQFLQANLHVVRGWIWEKLHAAVLGVLDHQSSPVIHKSICYGETEDAQTAMAVEILDELGIECMSGLREIATRPALGHHWEPDAEQQDYYNTIGQDAANPDGGAPFLTIRTIYKLRYFPLLMQQDRGTIYSRSPDRMRK